MDEHSEPTNATPDALAAIDSLLVQAVHARASDIHIDPGPDGYAIRLRVDGLLDGPRQVPIAHGRSLVLRLMVAAQLLTYRLDMPQEGRLRMTLPTTLTDDQPQPLDLRLAVIPTAHGLRATVRLPAELTQPRSLDQLQLPENVYRGLLEFASADSGMLVLCGPAGSGKTTTIYALLEHIVAKSPGVSVMSLEDPVERHIGGVTQLQVTDDGLMSYDNALRSLLRHDPQVLAIGEIRDHATAMTSVQAALTGHRLIVTLHATSVEAAMLRLIQMGVEPYQVAATLWGVVSIRLLRRAATDDQAAGQPFVGRLPVAELARVDDQLRQLLVDSPSDAALRRAIAEQSHYEPMSRTARQLVAQGLTTLDEVRRVLGAGLERQSG